MKNTSRLSYAVVEHKSGDLLIDWVRRHPVSLFFALTFLFSWSIYAGISLTSFENETSYRRILGVAAFGPALSAILISRISNAEKPQQNARQKFPVARVILLSTLTFLLVAGVEWSNNVWWDHEYDSSLVLADAVLVTLATIVILWLFSSHAETGCRLLGAERGRANYAWMIFALVLWPALIAADNVIGGVLGSPLPSDPTYPDMPLALILIQTFFWALLFGGPLNEEPGWRGFALPRLQQRYSPLVASVILGALWGLWHVPLHFMDAYGGGAFGAIIRIQEIPVAILFTWLYNRSKGSLLVVLLLHASINTTGWIFHRSYVISFVLYTLLAAILVIKDRMWVRSPESVGP